jgi:hypothetical protein
LAGAEVNGVIYAVGGNNGPGCCVATVEAYTPPGAQPSPASPDISPVAPKQQGAAADAD